MNIRDLADKLRKDFIDSEPMEKKLRADEFQRGIYVGYIEIIESIEAIVGKDETILEQ